MVDEKKFRADLYYRLNVFPIFIPALRERRADIPLLVSHFTQLFAHRLNKKIEKVPTEAMNAMIDYSWPGNIRELQNALERAVLGSNRPLLRVSLADLKTRPAPARSRAAKAESKAVSADPQPIRDVLEDVERKQILAALEQSHGIVAGPNGAAARLGLKRSTLQLRMKKLGISPRR
jgi:transcriptional regulator with GAF, ATPase, and Fis domain